MVPFKINIYQQQDYYNIEKHGPVLYQTLTDLSIIVSVLHFTGSQYTQQTWPTRMELKMERNEK